MIDDQKCDFRMKAGAYQEGKHIVSVKSVVVGLSFC